MIDLESIVIISAKVMMNRASKHKQSPVASDGENAGNLKIAAAPVADESNREVSKVGESKGSPASVHEEKSSTSRASHYIEKPKESDVLFGRGRPYQSHPGNLHLHRLVAMRKDMYEKSRRFDKLAIADQIVFEIKSGRDNAAPGRFLRRVEGEDYWEEAPHEVCREKVAHALRGHIKQAKKVREISKAIENSREASFSSTGTLPQQADASLSGSAAGSGLLSAAASAPVDSMLLRLQRQQQEASLPGNTSVDQVTQMLLERQRQQRLMELTQASTNAALRAAQQAEDLRKQRQQQLLIQALGQADSSASALSTLLAGRQEQQERQQLMQLLMQSETDNSLLAALERQQQQQRQQLLAQLLQQQSNERNQLASLLTNASSPTVGRSPRESFRLSGNVSASQAAAAAASSELASLLNNASSPTAGRSPRESFRLSGNVPTPQAAAAPASSEFLRRLLARNLHGDVSNLDKNRDAK